MHYCDYCQRNFKTVQGLIGHQRMMQHGDTEVVAAPVPAPVPGPVAAPVPGPVPAPMEGAARAAIDRLNTIEGKLDEVVMVTRQLSEDVQPHNHDVCLICKDHESAVYESVVAHYEQIPGVTDARKLLEQGDSRMSDKVTITNIPANLMPTGKIRVTNFPYPELLEKNE